MTDLLEVTAMIEAFSPNAMQEIYDDGGFESYDATEIRLIEPAELDGKELKFYHNDEVPEGSIWREVGRHIYFKISKQNLGGPGILFSGSASNLRYVDSSQESQ